MIEKGFAADGDSAKSPNESGAETGGMGKPRPFSFYLLAGCAFSLGFSAALLFPASELFRHSVRALGITQAEAFQFHLRPRDLLEWISPVLSGLNRFNPAVNWWTCLYLGFSGFFLILLGLSQMPLKKKLVWLLWISCLLIPSRG